MTVQEFSYLLKNPGTIREHQVKSLENLCHTYPYLQSAKSIFLKALKDKGSFRYNQYLKTTAAHTVDRWVLFDFITSPLFTEDLRIEDVAALNDTQVEAPKNQSIDFLPSTSQTEKKFSKDLSTLKDANKKNDEVEKTELSLLKNEISQKPLLFNSQEKHSFMEWLQLTDMQPLSTEDIEKNTVGKESEVTFPQSDLKTRKSQLIDRFISKNPKIKPADKKGTIRNLAKDANISSEELMTETLARVYIAQHKYKKAIQAYKILILKNPEKSGFFADQIRAIQKIQDTKS